MVPGGFGQGLFPSYRSLDDPASLEEERRLCYVGITRASVCSSPMPVSGVFGVACEAAVPSVFLSELPEALVQGDIPRVVEQRFGASGAWNGSPVWIGINRHQLLRMRCGDVRQGCAPGRSWQVGPGDACQLRCWRDHPYLR